jgi:hypothetical protein
MVQIEVSGPDHSRKGYILIAIARALRELGADVSVLGEGTHLADKVDLDQSVFGEKLAGQTIHITELRTGV